MKKTILLLLFALLSLPMAAQRVFTVAYATSDDGFVNVRATPTAKGKIVAKVLEYNHGLGNAVVLGTQGLWTKVYCDGKTGYAYTKYLGFGDWYSRQGRERLIASVDTPVYTENFRDGGAGDKFCVIKAGTIIADHDYITQGAYYILTTAHDNLYIPKKNVKVEKAQ